jgi:hypothetical protein
VFVSHPHQQGSYGPRPGQYQEWGQIPQRRNPLAPVLAIAGVVIVGLAVTLVIVLSGGDDSGNGNSGGSATGGGGSSDNRGGGGGGGGKDTSDARGTAETAAEALGSRDYDTFNGLVCAGRPKIDPDRAAQDDDQFEKVRVLDLTENGSTATAKIEATIKGRVDAGTMALTKNGDTWCVERMRV